MENKKQKNTIYNLFCISICLPIWLLSYFNGHIYLSSNGYAILKENLINPIGVDKKGHAEQSIMHEMTINGGHFYLMYIGGEEYIYQQVPKNGLRFLGEGFWNDNGYFMEFYIAKENGEFYYEALESPSYTGPDSYFRNQRMICDFIVSQWHNFNTFGYARMEGGHPLRMLFTLALFLLLRFQCLKLVQKWNNTKKIKIYQKITYGSFIILQLAVSITSTLQFVTFIY